MEVSTYLHHTTYFEIAIGVRVSSAARQARQARLYFSLGFENYKSNYFFLSSENNETNNGG
jgi:hypothetical protein